MLVEAPDATTLSRRMQAFAIRLAKGLNALMKRAKGRVFAERYHLRVLGSPTQVRNALAYVLLNAAKHHGGERVDPYSSGPWFDGWSAPNAAPRWLPCTGPPTTPPRTWLMTSGWRALGRI